MSKQKDNDCLRCGACCYYKHRKGLIKRCKYLRDTDDGKTKCSIYSHRLGTTTDRNPYTKCSYRSKRKENFPGCPYNIEGQPMFNEVKE